MKKHATISPCGKYRYWLERIWDDSGSDFLNFIMLNPSTADAEIDDPTIRKCIGFAKRWGFGGMHVVNLFALRATNPRELFTTPCPLGPHNESFLNASVLSAPKTVVDWGACAFAKDRAAEVLAGLPKSDRHQIVCLGLNADGSPKHPLYVPYDVTPIPYPTAPTPSEGNTR